MATFFTSDTHYGHKNICSSTTEWTDKSRCRQYPSVELMNTDLVDAINSTVGPEDTLYHLGDWSFGGIDNIFKFRDRLNVKDIRLILGNHDHHIKENKNQCQRLFTSVKPYDEIKIGGQEIVLSHYAFRVWNRQGKGAWHLYGHSHGNLPRICNKSLDVGVDGSQRTLVRGPWSMDEIAKLFLHDDVMPEDHHNSLSQTPPFKGA